MPFFVEKPVAVDLRDSRGDRRGRSGPSRVSSTAVGYHWRYLDIYAARAGLSLDESGQAGLGLLARFDAAPGLVDPAERSRAARRSSRRRTCFDLARTLVGEVTTVYAAASRLDRGDYPEADIDDVSTATLRFETGAVGSISSTCLLRWPHRIGLHTVSDGMVIELAEFEIMVDVGQGRPVTAAEGDPFVRADRDFVDAVQGKENRIRAPYARRCKTHRLRLRRRPLGREVAAVELTTEADACLSGARSAAWASRSPAEHSSGRTWRSPSPTGQFQVETLYSGFSSGTELTFFKGTNPYLHAGWDEQLGVFDECGAGRASIRSGSSATWRSGASSSRAHRPSARATRGHDVRPQDAATRPTGRALRRPARGPRSAARDLRRPDGPDLRQRPAARGAPRCVGTDVRGLGDGVRGRASSSRAPGVVGLLTALWAPQLGAAEVAVVDADPLRLREPPRRWGSSPSTTRGRRLAQRQEPWRHGRADRGADVAFQCRGRCGSLARALRALRPQGTVIDLAFYQGRCDELRLGEEFHHNGLAIRCAQISRVPRGLAPPGTDRASRARRSLPAGRGELVREHVVTDSFPSTRRRRCLAELAARRRVPRIQAVFEIAS